MASLFDLILEFCIGRIPCLTVSRRSQAFHGATEKKGPTRSRLGRRCRSEPPIDDDHVGRVHGATDQGGGAGGSGKRVGLAETVGQPFLLPVLFGLVAWAGRLLRRPQLRAILFHSIESFDRGSVITCGAPPGSPPVSIA